MKVGRLESGDASYDRSCYGGGAITVTTRLLYILLPSTTSMHESRCIQHNDGKFHYLTPMAFYAKLVALYITKVAPPLPPPVGPMRDTHDTSQ